MTGPITTREGLVALTDSLLASALAHEAPGGLDLPGGPGGYGRRVDLLEGWARTFLMAGFRVAGERGADPHHYLERYAAGLAAGTDPRNPDRWPRLSEHGQAKVEAASIALVLDLTRPWLWDHLDARVQEQVVDYLSDAVGDDTYPRINWVWFRLVVQTFLRSVGGPHDLAEMQADLDTHDTFTRADGWLADGDSRAFDHYNGWALHLYPTLWARMRGAADLAAPRAARDAAALDRFLLDATRLVGADGSPLIQGRSLIYRFAAAAPYWVGAVAQVPSSDLGLLRGCALRTVSSFLEAGVPRTDGLLDLGWWGSWPRLAQSYSGPGSPYWAAKGLLGVALPADHPVWLAPEVELPAAVADLAFTIAAPGWSVTSSDGIVRLTNHGVDHAHEGDTVGDSPLYARLSYATATFPLLDDASWADPVDSSLVVVRGDGARSHRAGFTALGTHTIGDAVVGASRAQAHWIEVPENQHLHGSGFEGTPTPAGEITLTTVSRGPWQVHLADVDALAPEAVALELGGWAVSADAAPQEIAAPGRLDVASSSLHSCVVALGGWSGARVHRVQDAAPTGASSAVAVLTAPLGHDGEGHDGGAHDGAARHAPRRLVGAVGLTRAATTPLLERAPAVELHDSHALVVWADGSTTSVDLPPLSGLRQEISHSAPEPDRPATTQAPTP